MAKNDTLRLLARAQELCFKRTQSRAALALVLSLLLAGSVSVTSSLAGRANLHRAKHRQRPANSTVQRQNPAPQAQSRQRFNTRLHALHTGAERRWQSRTLSTSSAYSRFLMTGAQQSANAMNLAERGFVVLTPNVTKVLLGDDTRMKNVHDVLDHISWLTGKDSPLPGKVDRTA